MGEAWKNKFWHKPTYSTESVHSLATDRTLLRALRPYKFQVQGATGLGNGSLMGTLPGFRDCADLPQAECNGLWVMEAYIYPNETEHGVSWTIHMTSDFLGYFSGMTRPVTTASSSTTPCWRPLMLPSLLATRCEHSKRRSPRTRAIIRPVTSRPLRRPGSCRRDSISLQTMPWSRPSLGASLPTVR